METIKLKVMQFLLNKYALGYIVKGWNLAKGYKTAIFVTLFVVTKLLEQTGQIPVEFANELYPYFETGAGISFIQKMARYKPIIDEIAEGIKKGETK